MAMIDTLKEMSKPAWAIVIIVAVVVSYLSLSWAGVIPEEYDVIRQAFGQETGNTTDVSGVTVDDPSVTRVVGVPESVNLTTSNSNSFNIRFVAEEDYCGDFTACIEHTSTYTDADIYWTSSDSDWYISENGLYAQYNGQSLIPYEDTTITLHIDGDSSTRADFFIITFHSNGVVNAENGLVQICT